MLRALRRIHELIPVVHQRPLLVFRREDVHYSAVDKLDKMSWVDVKKEMVHKNGLHDEVANRIGDYIEYNGTIRNMLHRSDLICTANGNGKAGLDNIALLVSYLEALGAEEKISFNLTCPRPGLLYRIDIRSHLQN
jgi:hypothetical protein